MSTQRRTFPHAIKAGKHLSLADPKLGRIISRVGRVKIELPEESSVFEALASSIIYQQLSGKAAATILGRFQALFGTNDSFPDPKAVLATPIETLRSAGLSQSKALAILDLARKVVDQLVPDLERARGLSDEALIDALTQVRGIGVWTVHMFLIFTLGRTDVLPVGDYGVRKGFATVYGKKDLPTPQSLAKQGEKWRPYRSAAAWYLWRALELE